MLKGRSRGRGHFGRDFVGDVGQRPADPDDPPVVVERRTAGIDAAGAVVVIAGLTSSYLPSNPITAFAIGAFAKANRNRCSDS